MKPHGSRKTPVPQDGGGHRPLNSAAAQSCACPLIPPAKGSGPGMSLRCRGHALTMAARAEGLAFPLRWSRRTAERLLLTVWITHSVPACRTSGETQNTICGAGCTEEIFCRFVPIAPGKGKSRRFILKKRKDTDCAREWPGSLLCPLFYLYPILPRRPQYGHAILLPSVSILPAGERTTAAAFDLRPTHHLTPPPLARAVSGKRRRTERKLTSNSGRHYSFSG